jgi:hypothetical protein
MASYPSNNQLLTSAVEYVDDQEVDRSVAGATKVRLYFGGKKAVFTVRHVLDAATLATLFTFYDTNRALTVTFNWQKDNTNWTCLFGGPPKITSNLGAGLTAVECTLMQQ